MNSSLTACRPNTYHYSCSGVIVCKVKSAMEGNEETETAVLGKATLTYCILFLLDCLCSCSLSSWFAFLLSLSFSLSQRLRMLTVLTSNLSNTLSFKPSDAYYFTWALMVSPPFCLCPWQIEQLPKFTELTSAM